MHAWPVQNFMAEASTLRFTKKRKMIKVDGMKDNGNVDAVGER